MLNKVDALTPKMAAFVREKLAKAAGTEVYQMSGVTRDGVTRVLRALRAEIDDTACARARRGRSRRHGNPRGRAAAGRQDRLCPAWFDRATGAVRADWLASVAADVARLRARGVQVVLVSSGSIALGRAVLGLPPGRAGAGAESHSRGGGGADPLARAYEEVMAPYGIVTGQVLVTLDDSADRRRYLNSRATMETMLSLGVLPIVNENDTIAPTKSAMATMIVWPRRWR